MLEEFKSLRSEIDIHIQARAKLENQVFIGVFALYGWLFSLTNISDPVLFRVGLGLPIIISITGFLRWSAIQLRTVEIGTYLKVIEIRMLRDKLGGWENYLDRVRTSRPIRGQMEGWVEFIAWLLLFLLTITVYLWNYHKSIFVLTE